MKLLPFRLLSCAAALLITLHLAGQDTSAQEIDPFDPQFDVGEPDTTSANDEQRTAEQLLSDARALFLDERPLEGRSKLLVALRKEPKNYRIHVMLSGYYIQHVGHFRLALRYILRAQELFLEKNGPPPYDGFIAQAEHMQILYLLSQARLNLDDYEGALDVLDSFADRGYYDSWYPGTRAWVLMKLGRLDEAIRVAKVGMMLDSEKGRTLNMLGILLSMNNEREQSLKVLREALEYEMSLGREGQPATPLNNSGEVLKELFLDERAESAWRRATSMSDGCEHVLPALNLALLQIEQMNYRASKEAIDNFESCVAQFPLRNGEEHRALVHLARGRIALLTGHIDSAVQHFEQALEARQWFGKIGTDEQDLEAAALVSLSQALKARVNAAQYHLAVSAADWAITQTQQVSDTVRSWWLMRRARQLMTEKLRDLEDLEIRHTDSLIEYSSFGDLLAGLPERLLNRAIETVGDERSGAAPYYNAYRAQLLYQQNELAEAEALAAAVEQDARPQFDGALLTHLRLIRLATLDRDSREYQALAIGIHQSGRARLLLAGLVLPVTIQSESGELPPAVLRALTLAPFIESSDPAAPFVVSYREVEKLHEFSFTNRKNGMGNVTVRGEQLEQTINQFTEEVFSEPFSKEQPLKKPDLEKE